jgi:hypothetical protein
VTSLCTEESISRISKRQMLGQDGWLCRWPAAQRVLRMRMESNRNDTRPLGRRAGPLFCLLSVTTTAEVGGWPTLGCCEYVRLRSANQISAHNCRNGIEPFNYEGAMNFNR